MRTAGNQVTVEQCAACFMEKRWRRFSISELGLEDERLELNGQGWKDILGVWLSTPVFLGFPGGSAGKESAHNAGNLRSVPGLGRSPGEGKGYLPTPVF